MASYSIFPKPGPPAQQACQPTSKAPQSRFVEGSMNDRISNVPPRDFLGPEDLAAYERQFYIDNPPPRSSSSSDRSSKKASGGFFAPLWEKLHLTRAKSASSMASNKSKRPLSQQDQRGRQEEEQQQQNQAAPTAPGNPLAYPTREEVMENYKSLMDSGFFTAHAIQGGRHRPRTASGQLAPVTESPAPPTKTFTQHLAQNQQQQQPRQQQPPHQAALAFSSIPYSATKAPASGDPPQTLYPRPSTGTRSRSNSGRQHPPHQQHATASTPPGPDESPQRGTKRAVADIAGGAADREWAETGARKLVKKLRKSASRISVDMSSLGAAAHNRSAETTASTSRPPTRNCSSAGGAAVSSSALANSSLSGKETPRHSVSTMRSFSSSWKPGAGTDGERKKSGGGPPNRLSKAKKVLGGGRRRRRSTSRSPGPVSHPPPPQRAPPSVPSAASASRRQAGPPSPSPATGEPMAIDSPPTTSTRPSFDGVVNGLSVPSFHYPQRVRARPLGTPEPLSVVPDANRGIPSVPNIPIHFKHRRNGGAEGSGSVGIRDSGVGDVENCESW